jgi:hypothetical protein
MNTKYIRIVSGAAAGIVMATTLAYAGAGGRVTTHGPIANPGPMGINVLSCQVAGTPSEFPDDLWVTNNGGSTLATGTQISWRVPSMNRQGTASLPSSLAPHQSVQLSGILAGGVEAGRSCTASLV